MSELETSLKEMEDIHQVERMSSQEEIDLNKMEMEKLKAEVAGFEVVKENLEKMMEEL